MNTNPSKEASESTRRAEEMVERLSERGHRITPQRYGVIALLADNSGHPSAEEIYRDLKQTFPTISLATVYKTLALLKSENEVLELGSESLGRRYDGRKPYPHPHAICTGCGAVMDLPMDGLENAVRDMVEESGYVITRHRIEFYGLCPACRDKA